MGGEHVLRCIRCENTYENTHLISCTKCGEILTSTYNLDLAREILTPEVLKRAEIGMDRFEPVLPIRIGTVSQREGDTPLLKSMSIGDELGLKHLYFKNETVNPTGSFKDRSLAIMIAHAKGLGYKSILTASTGNAGLSAASYGCRCGMNTYILVSEKAPEEKWKLLPHLGARVVRVSNLFEGSPSDLIDLLCSISSNLSAYIAFCWALINPISVDGPKIISYEILYQMEFSPPDFVIIPVGGGDNLFGQWKGYAEMVEMGMIDGVPKFIAVQAEKASPLVESFNKNLNRVISIEKPDTIASGINVAYSGDHGLIALKESDGMAISVSDQEIIKGMGELLSKEGMIVEPTSACVIPALKKLVEDDTIDSSDRVVCVLTGSGLKHPYNELMHDKPPLLEKDANTITQFFIKDGEKTTGGVGWRP